MKPLHEELKELREERQITLKDVARHTRIRLDFLRRLEDGDYTVAPMPFVRAFFREYAQVLEIDPAKAMAKLDGKLDTVLEPHATHEPEPEQPVEQEELTTPEPEDVAPTVEEHDTGSDDTAAEQTEPEPEQRSLFDDTAAAEKETKSSPEEPVPEQPEDEDTETPVEASDQADEVQKASGSAEEPASEPKPEADEEQDSTPEPAEVTEPAESAEPPSPTKEGTLEIDLDDNGKELPSVRRPLAIDTEKSFSNVVFATIVVILLVIAGVLIYLNRTDMF